MSNSSVATTAISAAIGGGTLIFFMAHPLSGAVVGGTLVGINAFHFVNKLFTKKEPQAKS
jgi:hypothetical protein